MNINKTLYQTIKKIVHNNPNTTAYDFLGFQKSYSEFFEDIEKCACFLKELGVNKGDIVSIYLPNIPPALELFFAINKIGAVSNFIHPQMPVKTTENILKKMNPKAVFVLDEMHEKLEILKKHSISNQYVIVKISDYLPNKHKYLFKLKEAYRSLKIKKEENTKYYNLKNQCVTFEESVKPKDTATILFTGGTTDNPKGVCLSSFNLNASAYQTSLNRIKAQPEDKMLAVLPIFHGYGLANCIYTTFAEAGEVVLLPYFKEKLFAKTIINKKPNYILGVPLLFSKLVDLLSPEDIDLSFLKGMYCGGSKLGEDLLYKINTFLKEKNSNVLLREGYGLTECVGACTLMPENIYKKNSVGIPYTGVELKITEAKTGKTLGKNTIGRICIKSNTVMVGYFKNKATNIHIDDGKRWLYTDDIGYIDEDGYLFFVDRLNRMVKILGYEVYPSNIEFLINKIENVADSCVVESSEENIKYLKAYVVLINTKLDKNTGKRIIKSFKKNLPKWSIPREIIFIKKMPETLLKKKDYNSLN
ncbi:MAG: class I adenylate-forming enzyme family protein [Eubacteriales bacterium]